MLIREPLLLSTNRHTYEINGLFLYKKLHELDNHFIEVFSAASKLSDLEEFTVKIEISHLVSAGKLQMASFLHELADFNLTYTDRTICVEWRCDYDDEDIEELGQMFQEVWQKKGVGDRFKLVLLS